MQKWSQRSSLKNKSKEESQFAKTFWRGKMTFWAVSSQVTKHGSTNMALKLSGILHNGRLPILHDQKVPAVQIKSQNNVADTSHINTNEMQLQARYHEHKMLLTFFDIRGIVQYEFVPTGQSTKFTICKYWKGCMKKLDGNDPNFLPTTHGSCNTTVHLLTQRCL